jgi:hypothetical protein
MHRSVTAVVSVGWFAAIGGVFGCLLPYLLDDWHFHRPLPYWGIARAVGVLLICAGLVPVVQSFIEFFKADGTPCRWRRRRVWWSAGSTGTCAIPYTSAS